MHVTSGYVLEQDLASLRSSVSNLRSSSPMASFYTNHFRSVGRLDLGRVTSRAAMQVRDSDNAGGSSIVSEVLSADILSVVYHATNVRTEMQVEYIFSNWKIADFVVECFGERVGVSVTRAMGWRSVRGGGYIDESQFDEASAIKLLTKKLTGLVMARSGVAERDSFYKSILHIFAQSDRIANLLQQAFFSLEASVRDVVICVCTVCDDLVVYDNRHNRL